MNKRKGGKQHPPKKNKLEENQVNKKSPIVKWDQQISLAGKGKGKSDGSGGGNKPKIKPQDNQANQKNPNKGFPNNNLQWDKAQGNKGKQKNPNQK